MVNKVISISGFGYLIIIGIFCNYADRLAPNVNTV